LNVEREERPSSRPRLRLKPHADRRLKAGHPWVFSNEIVMTPELRALPPGSLVRVEGDDGIVHGTFTFNPHTLIAARFLDRDPEAVIDARWIGTRLERALRLRAAFGLAEWGRLVHAEADGLPGLVIDRYGEALALAFNTAGMARLERAVEEALDGLGRFSTLIARNDSPLRPLEGLPRETRLWRGTGGEVWVEEEGVRFPVDLLHGQKTGWYYDQRPQRALVGRLAPGRRVLDLFCHSGAFGLIAARAGAEEVELVDSSGPALALARRAAEANGLGERVRFAEEEAEAALARLERAGARFDLVVCDPPPFARSGKDVPAALRAYERLTRRAAGVVEREGFLLIAACSHHLSGPEFEKTVGRGLARARREGRVVMAGGAGPDHPVHPALPESRYLNALLLQLF
jgi:23S rRNA (cytosine1962-C5)-methyltransferase